MGAFTSLGCFCLVALMGISVWRSRTLLEPSTSPDINPTVSSNHDDVNNETLDGKEDIYDSDVVQVVINQLDAAPTTVDRDVQYNSYAKLPYDVWVAIKNEFCAMTGIEYGAFCNRIPAEFQDRCNFFSLSTRGYKDAGRDEDYLLHDYVFECYNNSDAKAIIALCSFEEPLQDSDIWSDDLTRSRINETMVTICKYESTYWARFTYQGVNYDVETRDLDQDGLETLLTSLLTE